MDKEKIKALVRETESRNSFLDGDTLIPEEYRCGTECGIAGWVILLNEAPVQAREIKKEEQ